MGLLGGRKIEVTLAAYGMATQLVRSGRYALKQGATVAVLLKKAGLRGGAGGLMCMIEGDRVEPDRVLVEGEELKVFHFAGGG